MPTIRRLPNGRYKANIADRRRGIKRTKRTFGTLKQAKEWIKAVEDNAHHRLLGRKERRLFGEALIKYLDNESTTKKTHAKDRSNARALRWPIKNGRGWLWLEEIPLEEDQLIPAINQMRHDHLAIQGYSRHGGNLYHLRILNGRPTWYWQPDPTQGPRPRPRQEVTDRKKLAHLERLPTQPASPHTIRIRLALVKRIISLARRSWRWIDTDFAALVETPKNLPSREQRLTDDQKFALLALSEPHYDDLILGASWIGWRKEKLQSLTWDRVEFPIWQTDQAGRRELTQRGRLYPEPGTSNKRTRPIPMADHVEQLLLLRWECRTKAPDGNHYVFHRGDGRPWGDHKKRWANLKRRAGVPADFVWHGLRHCWATDLVRAGATAHQLAAIAGWTLNTAQRYVHLHSDDLADVLNRRN